MKVNFWTFWDYSNVVQLIMRYIRWMLQPLC
jgi:hypothetical protein